jgi:formylmethanofuran dehydrogenase subunit C
VNLIDPTGLDPDDEPLTHIDPATGQPTTVPGINGGTVFIDASSSSSSSGIMRAGNGVFDGDVHLSLTSINFLGGQQNAVSIKNATPDQQSRFNDAYNEFWKRYMRTTVRTHVRICLAVSRMQKRH